MTNDFYERNIVGFRANHGRVAGKFEGRRWSSCTPVGARSGKPRTNITMYFDEGERYPVLASNAGADDNPSR
jgi:F420H(2)-dependent quinone reductase